MNLSRGEGDEFVITKPSREKPLSRVHRSSVTHSSSSLRFFFSVSFLSPVYFILYFHRCRPSLPTNTKVSLSSSSRIHDAATHVYSFPFHRQRSLTLSALHLIASPRSLAHFSLHAATLLLVSVCISYPAVSGATSACVGTATGLSKARFAFGKRGHWAVFGFE